MSYFVNKILKEFQYGKTLFGSEPEFAKLQGKKFEEDLPEENKILGDINRFISAPRGHSAIENKNLSNDFSALKSIVNKVPELLKPDSEHYYYRGISIPLNVLKRSYNMSFKTEEEFRKQFNIYSIEGNDCYIYKRKVNLKSKKAVSSWTTSYAVATVFSLDYVHVSIVVAVKPDDSFLFNTNFTNTISSYSGGPKEYEIVSNKKEFTNCLLIITKEGFEEILNNEF